ncbi:MAG: flagellin [Anaerolineae bacterium]|nr:flagellin [Anaerolineae bacterium]
MFNFNHLNKDESGQTALETAIILIAFIVVASVFAFAILSAGSASTEKGEQAIYSGLEGVQSSMAIKGAVVAEGAAGALTNVIYTVSLVSGGDPVDLTSLAADRKVIVGYRDATQFLNDVDWTVAWIGANDGDDLLEEGELAEMTVDVSSAAIGPNTPFTLEVKPPTGAVLGVNRTTPASIEAVMELR